MVQVFRSSTGAAILTDLIHRDAIKKYIEEGQLVRCEECSAKWDDESYHEPAFFVQADYKKAHHIAAEVADDFNI